MRNDVFYAFSKKKLKLNFEVSESLKFPTLLLGTVRLLSRAANLASKCDSSISRAQGFRDVVTFFYVI